jgi:hypothetical protein
VSDNYGTIGGGEKNQAGNDNTDLSDAKYATVGGGDHNTASGYASTVSGGSGNIAEGSGSVIGGGSGNNAFGESETIGGGYANQTHGLLGSIGGGSNNGISATHATVAGGEINWIYGNHSTIGGGYSNQVYGSYATVGGGNQNTASGYDSTVSGGGGNTAEGVGSFIGGGSSNHASGASETIGGGYAATHSTVAGGEQNLIYGNHSTIGGGYQNYITDTYSTISGGYSNQAFGSYATVPGGYQNIASGNYSFAGGQSANANHEGSFVWADAYTTTAFTSDQNNQFKVRAHGGVRFEDAQNRWVDFNSIYPINTSTTAYLSQGGEWVNASDGRLKENYKVIDNQQVLVKLAGIPITEWNYNAEDDRIRHIGPIAQDFYAAFQLGDRETAIGTIDADGVALAAIQGLYDRVIELEGENAELQQQIENISGDIFAQPNTTRILLYVLVGFVLILLVGFSWIVIKLKSLVPAVVANDS